MDLGNLIGNLGATLLGTVVGGPVGLATGAVNLVSDLFGVKPDNREALAQAIKADPEAAIKLQQLQNENTQVLLSTQLEMAKLELQSKQADLGDRANARQREIALPNNLTPTILASLVSFGWIGVQAFLLTHVIVPEMLQTVARLLGTLDGALMLVLSYYFGSSSGSQAKDNTMAQLAGVNQAQVKKP